MNHPWALRLEHGDAAALAGLRLVPGLEVATMSQVVWLRGQRADEELAVRLLALPAQDRYEWQLPDLLRRLDQRIPSHRLPALSWQPLNGWLQVELPAAALPADDPTPTVLRLVRSGQEHSPDLLLTTLQAFHEFVAQAAQVRLDPLSFAASADGHVLIQGRPLPPVPGARFVRHQGVAVPAGFHWEPAVSPEVLARRLGASAEALVLWNPDGTPLHFHREQFVPVTRSAVLATVRARIETA